ncbi:MAG: GNAT family N-acetyltransferase [Chloroflexi bacterium]|nr:GNAT family N-acetyltransferase [Chloroflexota bacterium]
MKRPCWTICHSSGILALPCAPASAAHRELIEGAPPMDNIHIQRLLNARQLDEVVELQKTYWGQDAGNLVPRHMLYSLALHGGHVIGAYADEKLVGFVMGFIGTDSDIDAQTARPAMADLLSMSKRMVVLQGYRGRNIGYRLKLAQRDIALKQAIRLVTWTFDPLLAANAHLNIRKLGAVAQRFSVNYFGLAEGDQLRSDRLVVEWWVTQRRVETRVRGEGSQLNLQRYLEARAPIVNRARQSGKWLAPRAMTAVAGSTFALVEIPGDFIQLEASESGLADDWRGHIREVFTQIFAAGYIITDFVSDFFEGRRRSFYLLSHHFDETHRKN